MGKRSLMEDRKDKGEAMSKPVERGEVCECGQDKWFDNRAKKKSGEYKSNASDFKCANKECGKSVWLTPMKKTYNKPKPSLQSVSEHENSWAKERLIEMAIEMASQKVDYETVKVNYDKLKKIDAGIVNAALEDTAEPRDVDWGDEATTI